MTKFGKLKSNSLFFYELKQLLPSYRRKENLKRHLFTGIAIIDCPKKYPFR